LFVNGIPVATAELKNPLTGQTVEQAKEQYRHDRDPREPLFARRTLVHFAVDPELVFVTTRLDGTTTRFLPFNTGSDGPGVDGGAGNPPARPGGYRTSYLWEQVWHPEAWLDVIRDDDLVGGSARAAMGDPKAQAAAFANNETDFGHVFDGVFEDKLIERIEDDTLVLQKFTDDDAFKTELTQRARRYAYEALRRDVA